MPVLEIWLRKHAFFDGLYFSLKIEFHGEYPPIFKYFMYAF